MSQSGAPTAGPGASTGPRLATPSLRRRVTLVVIGLVSVMLLVLGVVTDQVLADRLDSQLRQRLLDRADVADVLVDTVGTRELARRLEGEGVSVVLQDPDGQTYAEGPLAGGAVARSVGGGATGLLEGPQPPGGPSPAGRGAPPRPAGPGEEAVVDQSGDRLSVARELSDGTRVLLLADAGDLATTMAQVRLALLIAGLLVLVAAAATVPLVVRRALRPLDRITLVARSISAGDRDRRLRPTRLETELGRTAAAFDVMLDDITGAEQRATDSEARLRSFLFDAAHELRTPLTGVQAAAERVLRDDPDRAEREQVLTSVVRETRRAGRLVEDMLLMARIDQGLGVTREPVELTALVHEVVASRRLPHPGASWEVTGPEVVVDGDRDRLSQVLGNLLDNAVQAAGPTAEVRVLVRAGGDPVIVTVLDDGPGVPPEQHELIFERMVRLDESRTSRTGGVGLGLPIARGLARAHGGDLRAIEPPTGNGACFELSLPRRATDQDRPADGPPTDDPTTGAARTDGP